MVEKTVTLSGQNVKFKASAAVPRLYRTLFHRDVFKYMTKLEKSIHRDVFKYMTKLEKSMKRVTPKKGKENPDQPPEFEVEDLEIFENLAYAMAYHADMQIIPFPKKLMTGLTSLICFPSIRSYRNCFPFGERIWKRKSRVKKNLAKVSGR